jgi:ribosomal protein S18 acetylase RimI-like enzyme
MNTATTPVNLTRHGVTSDDIPFLTDVFLRAMLPHITAARGSWNETREQEQFLEQLSLSSTSVIRHDDTPVGFITAIEHPQHVELHTLCIAPEYQGRGFGTVVSRQLIAEARSQNRSVNLSVLKSNSRARVLYERLGFARIGESIHHIHMSSNS